MLSIRLHAWPSTSAQFITLTDAQGGTVGNLQLRSTGALRLRMGGTTIGGDSDVLRLGTVYRIGLRQQQGSGSAAILDAYLAEGNAPFGAPVAFTSSGAWTNGTTSLRVGPMSPTPLDFVVDDIRLDTAAIPTP